MATTSGVGSTASPPPSTTALEEHVEDPASPIISTTFLQLLTTQLKRNQNPLDPLDTNQFTQQLVQFAQVEQQIEGQRSIGIARLPFCNRAHKRRRRLALLVNIVALDGQTCRLETAVPAGASICRSRRQQRSTSCNSTGATGLYRHILLNARRSELRLGRPQHVGRITAGRRLQDVDHSKGYEQARPSP